MGHLCVKLSSSYKTFQAENNLSLPGIYLPEVGEEGLKETQIDATKYNVWFFDQI